MLWQGIAVDPARPEQPKDAASITHTFRCSNRLARVRRTRQKLLQEEEFLATRKCAFIPPWIMSVELLRTCKRYPDRPLLTSTSTACSNLLIAAAKPSHNTGPRQIVRSDRSQSPSCAGDAFRRIFFDILSHHIRRARCSPKPRQ